MTMRNTMCLALALSVASLSGCAMRDEEPEPRPERTTRSDKTAKGAIIGAVAGAVAGATLGEGEADEILAGAAIGAGIGAGVGVYMDRNEKELEDIPGATVERASDDMLLVRLDSAVAFDRRSANLTSRSRQTLDEMADVLLEHDKTAVVVQGYATDHTSETENMELSERRAEMVRNYLIGEGVDAERMTAVGHGETGRRDTVEILLKAKG
jgi:outer membrane protein OmpA-like peptidoglycan-associated protein